MNTVPPPSTFATHHAPPEPGLTPKEMIARATALRPLLRAKQKECEEGGKVPDDVNDALVKAGFYRIVQPRRFGGYEFDAVTFSKVMMEISRGCSETGWVLALTAGHPLLAAFFSEEGQQDVYSANGEFLCPAGFNPPGVAVAVEGGYRVSGSWVSASGIDHGTHFITQAGVVDGAGNVTGSIFVMVKRGEYSTLEDWHVMGMQGTGSKSVVAKDQFVPARRTAKTKGVGLVTAVSIPGPRIHDNGFYYGRIGAFLAAEGTAVAVGAARGALDLFEEVLRSKKQTQRPQMERDKDPEYQAHYGRALSLVSTAEAALLRQSEEYMEYCREEFAGGAPFDVEREQRLAMIVMNAIDMAWQAIDIVFRAAGTSASVNHGQPIGRIFRNIAAIRTHPILQLARIEMNAAKTRFGIAP